MAGKQPPTGYGAPAGYGQPAAPSGYGAPTGYGQPPTSGGYASGYGAQPAAPYAAPPAGPYASAPGCYGAPGQAPGGYGATSGAPAGYGAPPVSGYGAPPAPGGYGGYSQPQGGGYGQYPPQQGGYPAPGGGGGFPPGTDPEVTRLFQMADLDRSGTIDAHELGRVLSTGRVAFSPRTLRLMLHLFGDLKNDSTRIGPVGFAKLWKEIQQWNKKFSEFDRDGSGSIDAQELHQALMSFNFNIPPSVLQMLVSKYDVTGGSRSIGYDNFVECGFVVKGLTEKFKGQDKSLTGNATFDYTSFMLMVIPFVAA
ncbi:probable calcium-binding protein CML48 [Physcomitrium patens]|uniref:EF-hand domain-containing protein n=1 Tax=Physcomitrium patens TaxID=3218 RepID=A0A2K1K331_PHYPA|nr:probable calcium-binding protein CML49 [Physcomitrium patens]PNR48181.1 hypothetical protein PHYPA_012656 [Physcomitrium patens]|eukprot:XP_024385246.1 probable calcium-binding protein CML49 [Physcomitrella patens]